MLYRALVIIATKFNHHIRAPYGPMLYSGKYSLCQSFYMIHALIVGLHIGVGRGGGRAGGL